MNKLSAFTAMKPIITAVVAFSIISVLITACSPVTAPAGQRVAYFPVVKEPQQIHLLALLQGKLVLEDGSLRVADPSLVPTGGPSHLIIWPYGYSWQIQNNKICVFNDKREKVAQVGDFVKLGGGNVQGSDLTEKPPAGVEGPFWLTGDVSK